MPTVPVDSSQTEQEIPRETEASPTQETTVPETVPQSTEPISQRHDPARPEEYTVSAGERSLLALLHAMRIRENLPELTEDALLGGLAYLRASELPKDFSHVRPDGRDWSSVLTDYGYVSLASGETVLHSVVGYSSEYILEDWLTSNVSSMVLKNPAYTHVGLGMFEEKGKLYVVCILTAK